MPGLTLLSYFAGGAVFANAVLHFVAGIMGRAHQSPFGGVKFKLDSVNAGRPPPPAAFWSLSGLCLPYLQVMLQSTVEVLLRYVSNVGALVAAFGYASECSIKCPVEALR
jgi:hypothetical protein